MLVVMLIKLMKGLNILPTHMAYIIIIYFA